MNNMLEIAQPQPCTPQQLMDCVMAAWLKDDAATPPNDGAAPAAPDSPAPSMYGNLYSADRVTDDSKGTAGVKKTSIAVAIDYDDTLLRNNDSPATLDLWFEGLALFCLQPKVLFKDPVKQKQCWDQRVRLCGNHCKPCGGGDRLERLRCTYMFLPYAFPPQHSLPPSLPPVARHKKSVASPPERSEA